MGVRNLPHDRSDPQVVAALAAKEPSELLVWYLNWRRRLPQDVPRRVFKSPDFERSAAATQLQAELAQIVDDIEQGRPLRKYLSERVDVGFALPKKPAKKKLSGLRHLDLLLNAWGIHHLHISTRAILCIRCFYGRMRLLDRHRQTCRRLGRRPVNSHYCEDVAQSRACERVQGHTAQPGSSDYFFGTP